MRGCGQVQLEVLHLVIGLRQLVWAESEVICVRGIVAVAIASARLSIPDGGLISGLFLP